MEEFMRLNVEELIEKISHIVDDPATLEILRSERINGLAFLDLSEDDLKSVNLKLGPRKCLIKVISLLKQGKYEEMFGISSITPKIEETTFMKSEENSAMDNLMVPSTSRALRSPCCTSKDCKGSVLTSFTRFETVKNTLAHYPKGEELLAELETTWNDNNRRALIRIVVSELVEIHGNYYPPSEAKLALAKAIVSEFPAFRDTRTANCQGHENFYDNDAKKGFIEFRLFNLRKKLPNNKKKYRLPPKNEKKLLKLEPEEEKVILLSEEQLESYVSTMKSTLPSSFNKEMIKKFLQDTALNRRRWIMQGQSVSQILEVYPRLLAFNGEMIEFEYDTMKSMSADKFLNIFPTQYVPKILLYLENSLPDLHQKCIDISPDDLNFRALSALAYLLSADNDVKQNKMKGKKGIKRLYEVDNDKDVPDPTSFLIKFLPEGTNLNQFADECVSNGAVYPFLINVASKNEVDSKMYLYLERNFIELVHHIDTMIAIDLLYKTHFVFNLPYPTELSNFYNFLDFYIYDVEAAVNPLVSLIHTQIWNTNVLDYTFNSSINSDEADRSDASNQCHQSSELHKFLFNYQ